MDFSIENIGSMIREERILRGMTQEELGLRIGVGKAQISKIENGKGLTIKTVTRVLDALNLTAKVRFFPSASIDKRLVGYVLAVVNEFAHHYQMTVKEANNYLNRYKGLDFLIRHYEAEHLLSIDESVEDVMRVCVNNGGGVK